MPPPSPLVAGVAPAAAAAAPTLLHLPLRTRRRLRAPRAVAFASGSHAHDALLLRRAADVADHSAGLTSPHPNFGCVIARPQLETDSVEAWVVGEGFLYAQGTPCAELLAAQEAGEHARGATAYLNLEPGDCYGDSTAVASLVQEALKSCLVVNAPLLYRAAFHVPFSVLKYAMTADGKIAASSGHASWVSGKSSRGRVFELRGRSDAVIVGGNTVRLDDPRLTARHVKGHVPVRIVMSQSLNLPEEANLWNVTDAYTIVMTQRGARRDFQKRLAMKGVEVVEFDMLNPRDIYAFWAPKIIGGVNAPTPVGELGMSQMTQAIDLIDVSYEQIGRDMLMSGYIQPIPDLSPVIPSVDEIPSVDPDAHKFVGVDNPQARDIVQEIKQAKSPEEAARIGRTRQREFPELVQTDWESTKIDVMYRAIKCKFSAYPHLTNMLLSTAGSVLVEASPHDLFWGGGREGEGLNYLGRLLMQLRSEILGRVPASVEVGEPA
ncbi:hypothetical protein PR202_gb08499 [Eleusine coracana subsp. coracana]|uniref:CMP/dCMP-type deaminase domain-containing protein n=1 Tax=Eleusine coracana subsp. coracana TaxID=191504 RepID=A0AAV5EFA7_ELECO|nr:hypothetical protein PR202_gb08499 [Eleusine coracana subsp. coracana]